MSPFEPESARLRDQQYDAQANIPRGLDYYEMACYDRRGLLRALDTVAAERDALRAVAEAARRLMGLETWVEHGESTDDFIAAARLLDMAVADLDALAAAAPAEKET